MNDNSQKIKELGSGNILPLIFRYAWPAVVTMTINSLYNVIDRAYIGQGCGADAIAGLGITFPIMVALAAVGVLVGMGSSTQVSIFLGAGKKDLAEKIVGQLVAMKVLFGLIFPPLIYFFGFGPMLQLLSDGANADTLAYARQYLAITIFFNIFAHLGFGLSATMRAEGSPKQSMRCMLIGAITNIILDPIFIFEKINIFGLSIPGLGLNVAGAAWATNISMIVTCGAALHFYIAKKSIVRLRFGYIRIFRGLATKVLAIGMSPCLMQIMGAIIAFSMNYAFAKWSGSKDEGTIQMSAYNIYSTVAMLCLIPVIGIQQGLAPIIGFNWGAESFGRVRKTLVLGLKLSAAATILATILMVVFAKEFSMCFAKVENVIGASTRTLRIGSSMFWTAFINIAATTYFQAVGKPKTAIFLSLLRQCICLLPIVWFLPHFMDDKVLAIWLAIPISDVICQIATVPPLVKEYRFLVKQQITKHVK